MVTGCGKKLWLVNYWFVHENSRKIAYGTPHHIEVSFTCGSGGISFDRWRGQYFRVCETCMKRMGLLW